MVSSITGGFCGQDPSGICWAGRRRPIPPVELTAAIGPRKMNPDAGSRPNPARFPGGLLLAQRRVDVPTDLGDQLGAAGPLRVRCGTFQPTQVVDQAVSFRGVHRLSFR
jgi:hypothetical protein